MNAYPLTMTNSKTTFFNIISIVFGVAVFAAGIVNSFWGNDPFFGIFLIVLSFVFIPTVTTIIKEKTGFGIHWILKLLLAAFLVIAILGVGELFYKIDLMMKDLQ